MKKETYRLAMSGSLLAIILGMTISAMPKPGTGGMPSVDDLTELVKYVVANVTQPKPTTWYAYVPAGRCAKVPGPARILDFFGRLGEKTTTREFSDSFGNLKRVDVLYGHGDSTPEGGLTFYASKAQCEDEMINAPKALADKYR
jgi:hypothetical protein